MSEMFNEGFITNMNNFLFQPIKNYIDLGEGTVYIISPFITNHIIEKLLNDIHDRDVCVVTSWRADYLMSGVSSLELFKVCDKHGWSLYINNKLHAKFYSNSFNSLIVTSANCTEKALCSDDGNIEGIVFKNYLEKGNRIELNRLISSSTLVDLRIYEQYLSWFNKCKKDSDNIFEEPEIIDITPFYVFQLPATKSPDMLWRYIRSPSCDSNIAEIEHDLAIYYNGDFNTKDYDGFMENIRSNFLKHPFISSLERSILPSGICFGAFKDKVWHECADVPVPYKKDLTKLIQNLFEWFPILFPERFYVEIPGAHSQVMFRK